MRYKSFLLCVAFSYLFAFSQVVNAASIVQQDDDILLSFDNQSSLNVIIQKSTGKFGTYETIGQTYLSSFIDNNISGNPYSYYYKILTPDSEVLCTLSLETELFGPNVYIYSPSDDMYQVGKEINTIHDEMQYSQFGTNRYAFYFKPGNYADAGTLKIAYYMHFGGLGKTPYEIGLSNIIPPAPLSDNNGTCTFWRSLENFSVLSEPESTNEDYFWWGVSQAAPIRRVYSERKTIFDYYGGQASGGFAADCYFDDAAGSYSQQQWYTRNSYIEKGSSGINKGGWNNAYQGVEFGSSVYMPNHSDNWEVNKNSFGNVSRVETTPIIREKPFLFIGDDGRYKVFKPALRENSIGISYSQEDMGDGETFDLLNDFYIAKPGVTASTLNSQLSAGKHLFFTPGIYELEEPIYITKENAIILGTGYATLIPAESNNTAAIVASDVNGITIASLLFDTYYQTKYLLQMGPDGSDADHSSNPSLLADLFFRVGGVKSTNVNADVALEINSSNVIGDHFWIWRADHGNGVGWTKNTSKNGLIVNGDNVTLYGLFNEHFQEYQTLWNGEYGKVYFYQSETPYDPTSQSLYMSHEGTKNGYASYKVSDLVEHHYACMMGIYDVFIRTGSATIAIDNAIEIPRTKDVKIHHACNVGLSNRGGINYIVNESVKSTYGTTGAKRFYILDYCETGIDENIALNNAEISIYPNPVVDVLNISSKNNKTINKISILDLNGKVLKSQNYSESIDMSTFESGLYFISIETEGGSGIAKIIKQ